MLEVLGHRAVDSSIKYSLSYSYAAAEWFSQLGFIDSRRRVEMKGAELIMEGSETHEKEVESNEM